MKSLPSSIENECGTTFLLVALCLLSMVGIGALALDVGFLLRGETRLQYACDAATLRGLTMLKDGETDIAKVGNAVREVVKANLVASGYSTTEATATAAGISIALSEDNTRISIQAMVDQQFWLAQAVPGVGAGQPITVSSSASYTAATTVESPKKAVTLVLDSSTSMNDAMVGADGTEHFVEYIDAQGVAQHSNRLIAGLYVATRDFVNQLDGDYVSIIRFNNDCSILLEHVKVVDEHLGFVGEDGSPITNREAVLQTLYQMFELKKKTSIVCGLDLASQVLESAPVGLEKVVVLVTDGIPTSSNFSSSERLSHFVAEVGDCSHERDVTRALKMADYIRAQSNAAVHAIGLRPGDEEASDRYSPEFLARIAASTTNNSTEYECNTGETISAPGAPPHGLFIDATTPDAIAQAVLTATAAGAGTPGNEPRLVHTQSASCTGLCR